MADQATMKTNGPATASAPGARAPCRRPDGDASDAGAGDVVTNAAEFAEHLLTLAELQARLAAIELKQNVQAVKFGGAVMLVGAVIGVAGLPIALAGIAEVLVSTLGMNRGAALLLRGRRGVRRRRGLHRDRRRPAARLRPRLPPEQGGTDAQHQLDPDGPAAQRPIVAGAEAVILVEGGGWRDRTGRFTRHPPPVTLHPPPTTSVTRRPIMRSERTGAMSAQPMMPISRPAGSTTRTRRTPWRPEHLADLAQGIVGRDGDDPRLHDLADGPVDEVGVIGQRQGHVPVGQDGDRPPFLQDRHRAAVGIPEDHHRLEDGAERRAGQRRGRHHVGGGDRFERLLFFVLHHGSQAPGPVRDRWPAHITGRVRVVRPASIGTRADGQKELQSLSP